MHPRQSVHLQAKQESIFGEIGENWTVWVDNLVVLACVLRTTTKKVFSGIKCTVHPQRKSWLLTSAIGAGHGSLSLPRQCAWLPLHVTLLAVSEAAACLDTSSPTSPENTQSCSGELRRRESKGQFCNRTVPIRQPQPHSVGVFRLPNHRNTVCDKWSTQRPGLSNWFTEKMIGARSISEVSFRLKYHCRCSPQFNSGSKITHKTDRAVPYALTSSWQIKYHANL